MIRENGQYLAKLIVEDGAWIYVSGRAKLMPKSVDKAFENIIDEFYENGKQKLEELRQKKRYQTEVW